MSTETQNAKVESWARSITEKVGKAITEGISADLYADYQSPIEGFCFELYADLPYANQDLMSAIHAKLDDTPAFQVVKNLFRLAYGRNPL